MWKVSSKRIRQLKGRNYEREELQSEIQQMEPEKRQ